MSKARIQSISPTTGTETGRYFLWDADSGITQWDNPGAVWDEWFPQGFTKSQAEKTGIKDIQSGKAIISSITGQANVTIGNKLYDTHTLYDKHILYSPKNTIDKPYIKNVEA